MPNNIIAIIDDEPRWTSYLQQTLSAHGYETQVYSSLGEQIRSRDAGHQLAIVSTLRLSQIEKIVNLDSAKWIATTVFDTRDEQLEAYRKHAIGYIPKIFEPRDLMRELEPMIKKAENMLNLPSGYFKS